MSGGGHAPGPYRQQDNAVFDSAGNLIGGTSFERPNWRDNARLFAAAPELLEALKEIMKWEHVEDCGADSGGWQSQALEDAFGVCRAAIAKATGGQP